jgi:putative transcriptional regulator
MSASATTKKKTRPKSPWVNFDAMTDAERHAAARKDRDAAPITAANEAHLRRTPQVRVIRRALKLSQEEFAARFQVPLGTLRDWEQGRKAPDAAARAYLKVIARDPEAVSKALGRQAR